MDCGGDPFITHFCQRGRYKETSLNCFSIAFCSRVLEEGAPKLVCPKTRVSLGALKGVNLPLLDEAKCTFMAMVEAAVQHKP